VYLLSNFFSVLLLLLLLLSYVAQGCWVPSLAESEAVLLMQCPLLVRAGIYKFVHGPGDISHSLREGHHGIFNSHQLMQADRTPF